MTKEEFIEKWLKVFVPHLTKANYNKFIKNKFIWHAFSFEIIAKDKFLTGDEARKAYDRAKKKNALTLQLWFDKETLPLTEEFDTADKIEDYPEFYVVAENFSWTYIYTHETDGGCGPYFMRRS